MTPPEAPPEAEEAPTEAAVEVDAPGATEEPAEEAVEPTEAPAAEGKIDITVDFQGYGPGQDGSAGMALEALLSSYHELHPHVSVNHTPIDPAAWDDIQAWTEQRLVAQDGPDLLFCNQPSLIERWMDAGLIGLWDPYLRASNSYVPGSPRWGNQFILPFETRSNGKTARIGLDGTALGTFYNADLLTEMGLEPPATWPEQTELLGSIREHNKIPCGVYYGLASAVQTFDAVANQLMHELFSGIADGEQREPSPAEVARAVVDGEYGITSPEYQDTFRIATEWWQYAPERAFSAEDDIGYVLFLLGEAATRLSTVEENASLHRDVPTASRPFEWGAWPIPVIPKDTSEFATEKPPMALFPEGYLHYIIPAYNSGQKLDQTADFMMFLSAPENLGLLLAEHKGLVPNVRDTSLPAGLESLSTDEDATSWTVNSLGSTHINAELRDVWVQNWQSVLAGEMSADEYTGTMQLLLEEAARAELRVMAG